MALVLSCPRCLQARSIAAVDPAQPLFCPFCHLELEMPEMPAPVKAETARVRKRKARRWPLVLLALGVLLVPIGLVVAILATGRNGTDPQQAFVVEQRQRGTAYVPASEPSKPILVLSAAAESQSGVVDRRTTPLPPLSRPISVPVSLETAAMPCEVPQEATVASKAAPPPQKTIWPLRISPTEVELKQALAKAPEIDLDSKDPAERTIAAKLREATSKKDPDSKHPLLAMARNHPELKGLPFRGENDCQLVKEQAQELSMASLGLRQSISMLRRSYSQFDGPYDTGRLAASGVPIGETAKDKMMLATAEQIFTALEAPWRTVLIQMLAKSKLPEATAALARRAVFDLDASNRFRAVTELKERPSVDYLPVLVAAFRHPWPPAAENAADALMQLDAKQAVPNLVAMLEEPDPRAPIAVKKGEWPTVREVVRVNHLRNCMLCHAAQTSAAPDFRQQAPGLIPPADKPVDPLSFAYYSRSKGDFIRADVTYLKQDFAVMQPVENPGKWPVEQRYDYFVRVRPATVWERVLPPSRSYRQRAAVLMALKELTQMDCGDDAAAWREALEWME